MAVEVALAMLQQEGRWLMQLRDEIPTIVAPGCWGLFGGHLDPDQTPEQTLQRNLRSAHVFWAELSVSLEQAQPRRSGGSRGSCACLLRRNSLIDFRSEDL